MDADELLASATAVVEEPELLKALLHEIPAPIYLTDPQGFVTFFNEACATFAGREPQAGKDRWCVSWKLFTDEGKPLDHGDCPMATAIRSGAKVRGVTALAERPDGTRVRFMPFPTPLFSRSGDFQGAINMLIDITESEQADELRMQASQCRRLAGDQIDPYLRRTFTRLATRYEVKAIAMELLRPERNGSPAPSA